MTQEKLVCTCCEKAGEAHMSLSEGGKVVFVVCYECIGVGLRWLVAMGRKHLEEA